MTPKLFRNNNAAFDTPTLSGVTASAIHVAGNISWFKDGEWGIAYKKASATTWNYSAQTSKTIDADLTGLDAATKYDVCLYVKFDNVYQRGDKAQATTEAA